MRSTFKGCAAFEKLLFLNAHVINQIEKEVRIIMTKMSSFFFLNLFAHFGIFVFFFLSIKIFLFRNSYMAKWDVSTSLFVLKFS